jgi:hypothetical protein
MRSGGGWLRGDWTAEAIFCALGGARQGKACGELGEVHLNRRGAETQRKNRAGGAINRALDEADPRWPVSSLAADLGGLGELGG